MMVRAVQESATSPSRPRTTRAGKGSAQIFDDMRAGVTAPEKIAWVEDRRHAISLALDAPRPGDCLLIAGKGHESYQEFADTIIPFDDRQVVRELIRSRPCGSHDPCQFPPGRLASLDRRPVAPGAAVLPLTGFSRRTPATVRAGQMFVAIRTGRRDGHGFAAAAGAAGASPPWYPGRVAGPDLPRVIVADPLAAFQAIAEGAPKGFPGR